MKLAYATPSRRLGNDSSEGAGSGEVSSGFVSRGGFRGGPRGSRRFVRLLMRFFTLRFRFVVIFCFDKRFFVRLSHVEVTM